MSNGTPDIRRLWRGPVLAWMILIVLFAINLSSAYIPLGTGNLTVNLLIAVIMVVVLAIFLMDLQNAKVLIRVVAIGGLFWTIMMFSLTFSDYLSRQY